MPDQGAMAIEPQSGHAEPAHSGPMRISADIIHRAEQMVYAVTGFMLVLALIVSLAGASKLLWDGALDWSSTEPIFHIIDRLLFVLMLVEILHTVHASIRSGTLLCEPFLIVGLIACIRRMLVITLQTSQFTGQGKFDEDAQRLFHASMIELGVLAGLIIVLVASLRVLSRRAKPAEA